MEGDQCDQIGRFFCTLGNFLKPLATINFPKSPIFLGNFCKGVKISHFSCEIILGNFFRHLAIFFWSHGKRCGKRNDENTKMRDCKGTLNMREN